MRLTTLDDQILTLYAKDLVTRGIIDAFKLRYAKGGHYRRRRHVASTVTLVLEGEQILRQNSSDGSIHLIYCKKGDYALATADDYRHLE